MVKVVNDNAHYSKCVLRMGMRTNAKNCDFSDILGDETMETTMKESAEISMGTEISPLDLINIQALAEQVVSLSEYRVQLYDYLKNRMQAIAPNLTVMVCIYRCVISVCICGDFNRVNFVRLENSSAHV